MTLKELNEIKEIIHFAGGKAFSDAMHDKIRRMKIVINNEIIHKMKELDVNGNEMKDGE